MKALGVCAREYAAPSQSFKSTFDYQFIFNKHINAIQILNISNNSKTNWCHDLIIC